MAGHLGRGPGYRSNPFTEARSDQRLGEVRGGVEGGQHGVPLTTGETLRLRGRIDLILARGATGDGRIPGDEAWIIDYKTGDPAALSKSNLSKGDGLQLALYGLAGRTLGAAKVAMSRIGPSLDLEKAQLDGTDLEESAELWRALASMQDRGAFGQLGALRSAYGVSAAYPLATLAVDEDVLRQKWKLTHPLLPHATVEEAEV